jgi:hypothetical protein
MTGIVDFRTSLLDKTGAPIDGANPLPVTGGGGGGGGGPIDAYALNDFFDGDPLYLGKAKSDGTWLLQKYGTTSGEMRYANVSNNAGVTTYASAWSGRTGLTYGLFQTLTGV